MMQGSLLNSVRKNVSVSPYPLIFEFEKWMQDAYLRVLPKSRMGKVIEYTYTLLPKLSRYVNDGRIEIDDNRIENAIRPLALEERAICSVTTIHPHTGLLSCTH